MIYVIFCIWYFIFSINNMMPNIWYRICIGFKYLIDHTLINIMLNIQYVHTALEGKLPYSCQVLWGLIGDLSGAESIFAWWFIFIGYLRVFDCQWGCGAVVHVNYGKADFAFFFSSDCCSACAWAVISFGCCSMYCGSMFLWQYWLKGCIKTSVTDYAQSHLLV